MGRRLRARPAAARISLGPRGLQARLVFSFVAVVILAILIVLVTLPNLLDGYFAQQEQKNLDARAEVVANDLLLHIDDLTGGTDATVPIVFGTNPPSVSPEVKNLLGTANDPTGLLSRIVTGIAQANLEVTIRTGSDASFPVAFQETIAYRPPQPAVGQEPDHLTDTYSVTVVDNYWSQFPGLAPTRQITVRLSDPWTFRAQALREVVGVMLLAGLVAMLVSILLAIFISNRLTTPIRRLTQASRALAEGDFDARVPETAGSSSPEVAELGVAFNRMADRLQESIDLMRRDRDRSRDFLADVSHELRTPLAALRTFNELLQEGAVQKPATQAEFLESSRSQIERLDWLAQNLLELSKLDSGLVALDLRPEDLRTTIQAAIEQAEPAAARKGVSLTAELPERAVRQRHDPPRVAQVLSNLIGNALKFTPSGGAVQVALHPTRTGAQIQVRDTGVGIAPEELPHVFDRFYRGARTGEVRASGSGLGLSIVRSIVEMHGGRVAIESEPGKGTAVIVELPREVAQSSPGASPV
jgi:signal transduction histidine kinase